MAEKTDKPARVHYADRVAEVPRGISVEEFLERYTSEGDNEVFAAMMNNRLVSLKAKTYNEAQQMSGIIVLPFILLIVAQVAGLITFRPVLILALAGILIAAAWLIILRIAPRFSRESIISTL